MDKNTNIIIILEIILILCVGILIGFEISNRMNNKIDKTIVDNKNIKTVEENKVKNKTEETKVQTNTTPKTNVTQNNVVISNTKEIKPVKEEKIEYSDKDKKVIEVLEEAYNDISNSEVTEKFKESAKATFVNIVDFIFYDGTIRGVTFKELTSNGKEKVLQLANSIDSKIESKVPNYKSKISNTTSKAYENASDLIKKGSSNLNDFLKEKLSSENYNAIINAKEDLVYYTKNVTSFVKDHGSKLFSNLKTSLSDWYNKYKNS